MPILRPIIIPDFQLFLLGQKSLAIGLYTGLILCTVVVVSRVALQFLFTRTPNSVVVIPAPKPALTGQTESNDKKSLEDSLSSIRSEIALLRQELSSLSLGKGWSSSRVTSRVAPPEDSLGWAGDGDPISFPVSQLPVSPSIPQHTGVGNLVANAGPSIRPSISPEYEPAIGNFELPDSAKNNPWASVLSGRQVRFERRNPLEEEISSNPVEITESIPVETSPAEIVEETYVPKAEVAALRSEVTAPSSVGASEVEPPKLAEVTLPNPVEVAETKEIIAPKIIDAVATKPVEESEFLIPVSL